MNAFTFWNRNFICLIQRLKTNILETKIKEQSNMAIYKSKHTL